MTYENEVTTAFDIVLEEIEDAIAGLNQDGAAAPLRTGPALLTGLAGAMVCARTVAGA